MYEPCQGSKNPDRVFFLSAIALAKADINQSSLYIYLQTLPSLMVEKAALDFRGKPRS